MYERHFGFGGPPFRLSPDPACFFASANHRAVLVAMQEIFLHPRPLLVISGELGCGKSTTLRLWLEECGAQGVVVAQLVSTQLDAAELVRAVAIQFGVATASDTSAEETEDRLRRHFLELRGRRVLLAIDESQNLSVDALNCVVSLTELALDVGTVFRVCLTGHPELRTHIAVAALNEVRERIQSMQHLGALAPVDTRGYVEHRLRKAGWVGVPSFDAAAFEEIYRFTEGVPRRINLLSNRLLLSQMLAGTTRIDAPCVITVARALRAETALERTGALRGTAPGSAPRSPADGGVMLLVASGRSDHVKVVPLLHAIECRADLPTPVLISASDSRPWQLNRALHAFIGLTVEPVELSTEPEPLLHDIAARFEAALERHRPEAVIVFDGNAVSQCCAMICDEHEVPLVHVGSDPQGSDERHDSSAPRAVIARIAALRFNCQPTGSPSASAAAAKSVDLGNPLIDAVRFALQMEMRDPASFANGTITAGLRDERRGYGVVALKSCDDNADPRRSQELLTMLREVSRDLPLVWPMRRAAASRHGLVRMLEGCAVTCIDELGHAEFMNLLRDATCVLTDCPDVIEEAAALHVPGISLGARHVGQAEDGGWLRDTEAGVSVARATRAVWQIVFNGWREVDTPPRWDGHAAPRIAACLADWHNRRNVRVERLPIAVGVPPG